MRSLRQPEQDPERDAIGRAHLSSWLARRRLLAVAVAPLLVVGLAPPVQAQKPPTTITFEYSGAPQTWTVPRNVSRATFDVYGAEGGWECYGVLCVRIRGGKGGRATATIPVTPGSVVTIMVGGEGSKEGPCNGEVVPPAFNGGAPGGSARCPGPGGGGASDVRIGGTDYAHRVLVAGGGGGASGGPGGGLEGGKGGGYLGGRGGNQDGTSGSGQPGRGGVGATGTHGNPYTPAGSGGGGGYYGGGGGGRGGGGGGGGSGFGPPGTAFQTGVREGHGKVVLTYSVSTPSVIGVLPAYGPGAGGQTVTITGQYFSTTPGETMVVFGSNAATDVTCQSTTKCTLTSPPSGQDKLAHVFVQAITPGGTSPGFASNSYLYLATPKITRIEPTHGPEEGGTAVTLHGSDFFPPFPFNIGVTTVTFGANLATLQPDDCSYTRCVVINPPGSDRVDVVLQHQLSGRSEGVPYVYGALPEVRQVP